MVCTSGLGGCTVATGFSSCNEDGAAVRMTFLCLCRWLPSSLTEHLRNTPVLNSWTTHSALRTHCGGSQFITITLQRLCLPHVRHGDRIFHNPLLVINLIVKGPGLILFLIPSSPDLGAFSFHYLPQPPPKKKTLGREAHKICHLILEDCLFLFILDLNSTYEMHLKTYLVYTFILLPFSHYLKQSLWTASKAVRALAWLRATQVKDLC